MEYKDPEFLTCRQCDSPCYTFDFKNGKILGALCSVCGNDETDEFALPEDYQE